MSESNASPSFVLKEAMGLFVRGLAMGAADVVPGVSGGTIAFITGIYERFINALKSLSPTFLFLLIRGRFSAAIDSLKALHWWTLIPVGLGVVISILTLSRLITGLMDDVPGPTYAFFFGLILASAWMPLAQMKTRATTHYLGLIVAGLLAWTFVGLQPTGTELVVGHRAENAQAIIYPGKIRHSRDLDSVLSFRNGADAALPIAIYDAKGILDDASPERLTGVVVHSDKEELGAWVKANPNLVVLAEQRSSLLWVFFCGLLGISAMVLPGLSGSFLLLFLGEYHAIFSALHRSIGHVLVALGRPAGPLGGLGAESVTADFAYVGVFLLGILIGLATFSRVVSWLFERAHDLTLAVLTGLMLGALRLPGSVVLEHTGPTGAWTTPMITAALGVVIVAGLAWVDHTMRSKRSEKQEA